MTYIVTDNCIKCKYMDCVEVCPVDCFYEGENMLVIHPDECIDCGVCEPECPAEAIKPDTEPGLDQWLQVNAEYAAKWPNITIKRAAVRREGIRWRGGQIRQVFFIGGRRGRLVIIEGGNRKPPIVPKSTIIVVGTHRSGSTFLCRMMTATGALGKPDEYFRRVLDKKRPGDTGDALAEAQRSGAATDDILSRVALAKERGTTANGVCSFKLFLRHFEFAARQEEFLRYFPGIRFIWIFRRDLLGQAISFALAKQTKKFRSYESGASAESAYERRQIEALMARIAEEDAAWRNYFAKAGIEPFRLCYEDFAADPMAHLRSIGRMVDVPLTKELPAAAAKMKVQRDEINEKWRSRFLSEMHRSGECHPPFTSKPKPNLFKQIFGAS